MNEKPYNYPAIKVRYPVTLLTSEGHVQGETRLINNRGALIRCHRPPRLHEAATISIDISENESLMVEAEVVRLEFYELDNNDQVTPRGMVVRFTKLSTIGRQRLRNLIAKHYMMKLKRMTAKN
jgi:PilZ domain